MIPASENIKEILGSLDGIKRAPAPINLYSSIKTRCNPSHRNYSKPSPIDWTAQLLSKPAINILLLFVILVIDCLAIKIRVTTSNGSFPVLTEEETIVEETGPGIFTGDISSDINSYSTY